MTAFLVSASAALAQETSNTPKAPRRPNVILIFADDLGPGLLGCNGQQVIKTPNIDRLAQQGMKFTNYYGAVYCAPARWTLLTGMHDGRKGGWKQTRPGLPIRRDSGKITEKEYQACILAHPDSWSDAVTTAVRLGGDVDTLGAIVGALAGARHGIDSIPTNLVDHVQDSKDIQILAARYYAAIQHKFDATGG